MKKVKTFPTLIMSFCRQCQNFLDCYLKHQKGQSIDCETVVEKPDKFEEIKE